MTIENQKKIGLLVPLIALALVGCDDGDESGSGGETTAGVTAGDGDGDGDSDGDTGGDGGATGQEDGDGDGDEGTAGDGDGDSDSGTFVVEPDGGATGVECDVWTQDCPEGQKCAAWINDGGAEWNAVKCVDVDANPGVPGDSCTAESSGVTGVDSCEKGAMCWAVDESNVGTCVGLCTGSAQAPMCAVPGTHCSVSNEGVLNLCLAGCDPVLQDCREGEGCYSLDLLEFECVPDASGPSSGAPGDPCAGGNACDPGLFCGAAQVIPGCTSAACCTAYCDLTADDPASQCMLEMQECTPVFADGSAPPGYEHVGICALP